MSEDWFFNLKFFYHIFWQIAIRLTFCSRRGWWEEEAGEASKWPWCQLCQSLPNLLLRLSCFIRRNNGWKRSIYCSGRSKDPLLIYVTWGPFWASPYWSYSFRPKMLEIEHQALSTWAPLNIHALVSWINQKEEDYLDTHQYCRPLFPPEPDTSFPHASVAGWPPEFWSWFLHRKYDCNHPMQTNR